MRWRGACARTLEVLDLRVRQPEEEELVQDEAWGERSRLGQRKGPGRRYGDAVDGPSAQWSPSLPTSPRPSCTRTFSGAQYSSVPCSPRTSALSAFQDSSKHAKGRDVGKGGTVLPVRRPPSPSAGK